MASTKTRNAESYNLVLRGRYFMAQPKQDNLANSVTGLREALRSDSSNASAYAGLARAYRVQAGEGWRPLAEGYQLSRDAARKAIALDPQLAEGYEALAYVQSAYDWDWDAAEASYRRALELEPGNAEVLRSAALLMAKLGRLDEAIVGLRKAVDRDPLVNTYSALPATYLGAAGRWDEAEGGGLARRSHSVRTRCLGISIWLAPCCSRANRSPLSTKSSSRKARPGDSWAERS